MSADKKENKYRDTLNLPKTDFPIRAQNNLFDQQVLKRWEDEKLSELSFFHNQGKAKFILHDGPPYANGNIHLGHSFNKILKDIFAKFERMSGKHVPIIPGWDCHGLPIELKVTQENPGLDRENLKIACRAYAQKWVDVQKQSFKNLGVLMHWDKPYATMDYSYESFVLKAFKIFYESGYIQRQLKTVPWCASCQTVLAHAEIEYEDRKDPSIYVQFPLEKAVVSLLFPNIKEKEVCLLVWTTTPWTLPVNRAVVIKPGVEYQVVKMLDKYVIMAKALVDKVSKTVGCDAEIIYTINSDKLIGKSVSHPFVEGLVVPIIGDGFTSLEDGTACVHSAPGCGPEDYDLGVRNKLEIYSPLSSDGKYTCEILPKDLNGMSVDDGQIWVIKKLAELNRLFFKQSIRHSYPHCWRCHKGLIFRANEQWFCDLSKHRLKDLAIEAIEDLDMLPVLGKNRFRATLEGRLEWCLSRQRVWGVPIPAVRCVNCNEVQTSLDLIEKVSIGVAREGIEFWDRVSVESLGLFSCKECSENKFEKEFDILDVWFESGVSHFAILYNNLEQGYPADLYLEGKDQHRAWFQSSLLTSLVIEKCASMKSIVTHGFTVDEKGRKMSKSLGNVISPQDIVAKIGLDGLRLWVASCDYDSDPVYSDSLIQNVAEVYRKVRNTCRFLLSNLYDFDFEKDAVSVEDMLLIDQYAIVRLNQINKSILDSYQMRKTTSFFHEIADFCVKDLSSFYLDIVKDRLYTENPDGLSRRSAQTACYLILDTITKLIAPVLSCTAELVSDHYQIGKKSSIHLQDFVQTNNFATKIFMQYGLFKDAKYIEDENWAFKVSGLNVHKSSTSVSVDEVKYFEIWNYLLQIRTAVLKRLEELRNADVIRHSLDAAIVLYVSPNFAGYKQFEFLSFNMLKKDIDNCQNIDTFLKEYLIVSQLALHNSVNGDMQEVIPGVFLSVYKAIGEKCVRCWQWSDEKLLDGLCPRCAIVLKI